jgi:hypothetical protein
MLVIERQLADAARFRVLQPRLPHTRPLARHPTALLLQPTPHPADEPVVPFHSLGLLSL